MIVIKSPANAVLHKSMEALVAADQLAADRHNMNLSSEIRRVGKQARKAARVVRAREIQRRAFLGAGGAV